MKNREELAKYFKKLGFKVGAEVGVYKGAYSVELCKANPGLKLYCIDSWGIGKKNQGLYKKIYDYAQRRLSIFGATLIKDLSMDAVKKFDDNSLDFVYIDAEHIYPEPNQDIDAWAIKVRQGGIVSGHDYDWVDVKRAVDEYVLKYNYKLNTTEDENCSWWFIK
jgi:predicted O-methyltransferase YrrM